MKNIFLALSFAVCSQAAEVIGEGLIYNRLGIGIPNVNSLHVVEFSLGLPQVGVSSSIVESYAFSDINELTGSLLPIYINIPLYSDINYSTKPSFKLYSALFIGGSFWGYRFRGTNPFDYIIKHEWLSSGDYLKIGVKILYPIMEIFALNFEMGGIFVEKRGVKRIYGTLSFAMGTSGPIIRNMPFNGVIIEKAIFVDSKGNEDGVLQPNENSEILLRLSNRAKKDIKLKLYIEIMDRESKRFISLEKFKLVKIPAKNSKDITIPLKGAYNLPPISFRIKIWGKDEKGDVVKPYYIVINSGE